LIGLVIAPILGGHTTEHGNKEDQKQKITSVSDASSKVETIEFVKD
jgi:hypothetical protein